MKFLIYKLVAFRNIIYIQMDILISPSGIEDAFPEEVSLTSYKPLTQIIHKIFHPHNYAYLYYYLTSSL